MEVEPGLPRAWVDRAKLADALALLGRVALRTPIDGVVRTSTARVDGTRVPRRTVAARLLIAPFRERDARVGVDRSCAFAESDIDEAVAVRLLETHGAHVSRASAELRADPALLGTSSNRARLAALLPPADHVTG